MTASEVVAHFPDAKRNGAGWTAKCPAHEDRRASLSIGEGEKGAVLKCFAGCDTAAVLGAIGLKMSDLFPADTKPERNPRYPRNRKKKASNGADLPMVEAVTQAEGEARYSRNPAPEPVPDNAPPPPLRHRKLGTPSHVWEYRDEADHVLGYVCRYETKDGKEIRPLRFTGGRWQWKAIQEPRPLYGLDRLAARPDAPVVITEGEKAADAAGALLPDHVAVTSAGGAEASRKSDWAPLLGRDVLLWPDHDDAGRKYAAGVAQLAREAGALSVQTLDPVRLGRSSSAGSLPKGWDAADALADGWTAETVAAILATIVVAAAPEPGDQPEGAADAPRAEFSVKPEGVFYHGRGKDGEPLPPEWICSRLEITAKTRDPEQGNWGRLLEWTDDDRHKHRWPMPADMLAGSGEELRRVLLAGGLEISPKTAVRWLLGTYIQTTKVSARALCTDKAGWFGGVYVLPDESIGASDQTVLLQTAGDPPKLGTAGTLAEWRDNVARLAVGNSRLTLATSAAFAAPLLEPTGDASGGINFVGPSSTGKTTALHMAVSASGEPERLQRFRATGNGLEAVALAYNDALLCLDELAQVDAREAGDVAYMLANGAGKVRARRDGLAQPKATWRSLFLSAGEIGLAEHMRAAGRRARAGQEIRLADVPADAGAGHGLFEELHGHPNGAELSDAIRLAAARYYGTPFRGFLRKIVREDRADLVRRAEEIRRGFVADALDAPDPDGQVRRVADRFGLVAAGGELASGYGITGWPAGEATKAALVCFRAWLARRGGNGSQEAATALAQVRAFFEAHGESRFADKDRAPGAADGRPTINRAGFRRIGENGTAEYWVLPEAFRGEVCEGLDTSFVAKLLVERGWIQPDSQGRATSTHKLPDMGARRCYHLTRTDDEPEAVTRVTRALEPRVTEPEAEKPSNGAVFGGGYAGNAGYAPEDVEREEAAALALGNGPPPDTETEEVALVPDDEPAPKGESWLNFL